MGGFDGKLHVVVSNARTGGPTAKVEEIGKAYEHYLPLCALVSLQLQAGLDGFLAIEKYMMKRQGLFTTDVRRNPIEWKMDLETQQELERLLMLIDL